MSVPMWVRDAIFYQIFPDRFANGDPQNDLPKLAPWDAEPTSYGFHGGDLKGIIDNIGYLSDLGINAIYLNPIFLSPSNHRYNITDYYRIDPKLGTMQDFRDLMDRIHQSGMKIILDGVFNHCGRGFFAFNDVIENQEYSQYSDWFHIKKFPIDAYSPGKAKDYLAWWDFKSLPKFNTANQRVRNYIMKAAVYWVEQGADGWRLDVPNEIADDSFWEEFRTRIKAVNPDAYLVGEIWVLDNHWVGEKAFDGLMNYPARDLMIGLINGKIPEEEFTPQMDEILNSYPFENLISMYVPLGSHDTERIMTVMDNDLEKVKLAYLFQFAFPGSPAIYYGDEIGMPGGKDPLNRKAFNWDRNTWKLEIQSWVKNLIQLRKKYGALRKGRFQALQIKNNQNCYAFLRTMENEHVVCVLNPNPDTRDIQIDITPLGTHEGRVGTSCFSQNHLPVVDNEFSVILKSFGGDMIVF